MCGYWLLRTLIQVLIFGRNVIRSSSWVYLSDIPSSLTLLVHTLLGYNFVYTIGYGMLYMQFQSCLPTWVLQHWYYQYLAKYNSQNYLKAPRNIYFKLFEISKYLISFALLFRYLSYDLLEIGSHTIDGVQERYFIPLLHFIKHNS